MTWQPLARFRDRAIPKIDNLRRARAAGLRVPDTFWVYAGDVAEPLAVEPPAALLAGPCIIRSGSPTEDTFETSNAGQLLSVVVRERDEFGAALAAVIAALPRDAAGAPLGAAFVQPLVVSEEAGVAFLDGFYFEQTVAAGSNEALTSGQARGEVRRGHFERDDAWSSWTARVYQVFASDGGPAIDIEFARDAAGYILLQARPALFELAENPILSLANHKEILGDPPSPWIVSVLVDAGREVLSFFGAVDARVAAWKDHYAIELADRAWMNFSFFFRLMDHWGLPRQFVVAGVGGEGGGPGDARILWGRFSKSAPRLVLLQLRSLFSVFTIRGRLAALDREIAAATTLADLYAVNVSAMRLAIGTNFAINSVLTGVQRVRRALRIRGDARVVTQVMMEDYRALAFRPPEERDAALDGWLASYGHRGPLESDPARPRFAELREALRRDLDASAAALEGETPEPARGSGPSWIFAPLYWIDARREWFRDQLMRRWQRIRDALLAEAAALVEAGRLARVEDVFSLRGSDLGADDLAAAAEAGAARVEAASRLVLPHTAPREELVACLGEALREEAESAGKTVFSGIALSDAVVEGVALRATDLTSLLGSAALTRDTILVVAALEPSWAVVFPRVGGVVAEIGGELSHASILLREARRPAIVNAAGIFARVATGDRLRLDGAAGLVEVLVTR